MHAMVAALDDFVGNVTSQLKTGGLWEQTLVAGDVTLLLLISTESAL
jgi:hypothetical protein